MATPWHHARFVTMPRYFFHLHNDVVIRDKEGEELPDIETAHNEALQAALALICLNVRKGHLNLSHCVEVIDEDGECVVALPFRDVLTITG